MMDTSRRRVALLQRSIPHYRLPLFEKLTQRSRHDWTFYCAAHRQGTSSGLTPADYGCLDVRPVRRLFIGPFACFHGLKLDPARMDVLMLDLGWSILSNPVHLALARLRGVSRVGWSKGISQSPDKPKGWARRRFEAGLAGECEALVVYGAVSKRYFEALGYPAARIFVAWNSPDTAAIARADGESLEHAQELRRTLGLNGRPIVGYLGKLTSAKRVDAIVAAFRILRSSGSDACLIIAGIGPEEGRLRRLVADGPFSSDIRLLGPVPIGSERAYHRLFDVFVSFKEGGLGLLEAAAAGCPVVTTPEPFPEVEPFLEPGAAFVAPGFTPQDLAVALGHAIDQKDLRLEVAARTKARVLARYSHEAMVEAIDAAVDAASRRAGEEGVVSK